MFQHCSVYSEHITKTNKNNKKKKKNQMSDQGPGVAVGSEEDEGDNQYPTSIINK